MTTHDKAIRYFKHKAREHNYKFMVLTKKHRCNKYNDHPNPKEWVAGFHSCNRRIIIIYDDVLHKHYMDSKDLHNVTEIHHFIHTCLHEYCHMIQTLRGRRPASNDIREFAELLGVRLPFEATADRFAKIHYNRLRQFLDKAGVS